jgi:hypothetical protein
MNYPAESCGVSERRDENDPHGVTPFRDVFIGDPVPIRLDSRLKHAKMTVVGMENQLNAASCEALGHRD